MKMVLQIETQQDLLNISRILKFLNISSVKTNISKKLINTKKFIEFAKKESEKIGSLNILDREARNAR